MKRRIISGMNNIAKKTSPVTKTISCAFSELRGSGKPEKPSFANAACR